jgi:hypothetical protein
MPKRKHTYFKECTQELKYLPVTEPNCYYLGKFDADDLFWIQLHLDEYMLSWVCLQKIVNENIIKWRK